MSSQLQPTIWGIHGGKTGDADNLFRKQKTIGLGWPEMGDLKNLTQTRDAYKARLGVVRPDMKTGAIPVAAGQLYRFVKEIQLGDFVIYRSKVTQHFHIGTVQGDYIHNATLNADYPHQRTVEWIKEVSPTTLTQGALYEMGAAMSFFQVRSYADEWQAKLTPNADIKKTVDPIEPHEDDSVAMVADSIAQNTRDFILKQFQAELKGHPFAEFVAHLLSKMGYVTRLSPPGADGGVDIIAHKDELGFEPPIIKVQVKSQGGNVGNQDVAYLSGILDAQNEFGLVVSLSDFTTHAKTFAVGKSNLRLLNAEDIIDLTLAHYDALEPRYKAIIPLKQVFVPEPLDD